MPFYQQKFLKIVEPYSFSCPHPEVIILGFAKSFFVWSKRHQSIFPKHYAGMADAVSLAQASDNFLMGFGQYDVLLIHLPLYCPVEITPYNIYVRVIFQKIKLLS